MPWLDQGICVTIRRLYYISLSGRFLGLIWGANFTDYLIVKEAFNGENCCSSLSFDMFLRFYWIYWSADDFKVLTFSINNSNSRTISDFKVRLSPSKKIYFYLLQWKPFKDDEKWFLLHLKSSFRSQYI